MASNMSDDEEFDVEKVAEAIRADSLQHLLRTINMDGYRQCFDFETYLKRLRVRIIREIYRNLKEYGAIKVMLEIDAEYVKPEIVKQDGGALERARRAQKRHEYELYEKAKDVATIGLITKLRPITHINQVAPTVDQMLEDLRQRHITKMQNGSGFMIRAIVETVLKVAEHTPLAGSSFLPLPTFLQRKRNGCFVNVQNQDQRCFGYAILASIKDIDINDRPERLKHYSEQDFELYGLHNLNYPVKIDDLEEIERQLDIPINVFTFFDDEGKGRKPIYTSKLDDPQKATDLLFWEVDEVGHFAWIRSFSGFVNDLNANSGQRVHWCKRCFSHFYSPNKFNAHLERCCGVDGYKCVHQLPPEGSTLEFKNVKYMERVPFTIYADFEAITKNIEREGDAAPTNEHDEGDGDESDEDDNMVRKKPKNVYQEHTPISVGLKLVSSVPGVLDKLPYETYTGKDVATWFLEKLLEYQKKCTDFLFDNKAMQLTGVQQYAFESVQACYICGGAFSNEKRGLTKVRDHDHISGEYRGAAHSKCNLLLRQQRKIPVFLHCFRGYDSHLIVPALGAFKEERLHVIAQTLEKYLTMSFSKHLVFKDSFQFLSSSLASLTSNLLSCGKDAFVEMRKEFEEYDDEKFELLLRKGVYPYDYMDNEARLSEDRLPPREAFFSRLNQEECSQKDYDHAVNVWNKFECKTMLDYHNLYLKCDVLQLTDVFESFRKTSLRVYELDPAHYVSAPHLSWDAMLHTTKCKLDLLSDDAMYSMIHQNLRGGVAMISKRRGTANNKYMKEHYDPSKPSKYLLYVDANNLYGWSMSQNLPDGHFEWLDESQWSQIDWLAQSKDQFFGYIVECDLDYPDHLHDAHSDYPLAPERMTVETELLSEAQVEIGGKYEKTSVKTPKLIPNLFPKRNYACHYMNLKFYLEHGMELAKIHRVIRFSQSKWLEAYIAKNSALRAAAKNEFEKNFYKLMNNSVYGKTTENVLNRKDIRLENDRAKAKKLINKPHCTGFRRFTPDIAAVSLQKLTTKIDKPTYVGFAVLEYAKLLMYDFHYNECMKQWPNGQARLVLTDTDSLLYEIETEDVYDDILKNPTLRAWFDTSNYPLDHPLHSFDNEMVIGKMKDECSGKDKNGIRHLKIMCDVVGLRAKMYSYHVYDPTTGEFKDTRKAKGIQRAAIETISHQDYIDQLEDPHENRIAVRRIGHMFHIVLTYEQSKRALCAFDDKRYLLPDFIDTLAHGHYKIRNIEPTANDEQEVATSIRTVRTSSGWLNTSLHNTEIEDDDGDRHLVVTHKAVSKSPMLSMIFSQPVGEFSPVANDEDDYVDFENEVEDEPIVQAPPPPFAPPAKRARMDDSDGSSSSGGAIMQQQSQMSTQVELAKKYMATIFTKNDFQAAETLVDYCMSNLGVIYVHDKAAALQDLQSWLNGKPDEAQSSLKSRALTMLNEAREHNKQQALSNLEHLLFVICKDAKTIGAAEMKRRKNFPDPCKLVYTLLSGRSERWYDNHHKALMEKLSKK
jgi:hypothetical protein